MPVSQKINEAGWFYHAPAKKKIGNPKTEAPAPSQIPGIGFDDPTLLEKEEVRPVVFKDSDSKYIQLAKMGGRKDLLSFNPEKLRKKQAGPVGYPRNEWFYLEDNRIEDEEKKKEESWDFLLPEYMVHKSYHPSFEDPSSTPVRSGAPYHTEKVSVLEREGRSATDKTVKIPEVRRPGFGVRNEKPPASIKTIPRDKDKTQMEKKKGKQPNQQMRMPTENEEPTLMSKLLAGGYEKDWHEKLSDLSAKEEEAKTQKKYPSATRERGSKEITNSKITGKDKALFKLSRFKNIPSKIEQHQQAQPVAHQGVQPVTVAK